MIGLLAFRGTRSWNVNGREHSTEQTVQKAGQTGPVPAGVNDVQLAPILLKQKTVKASWPPALAAVAIARPLLGRFPKPLAICYLSPCYWYLQVQDLLQVLESGPETFS